MAETLTGSLTASSLRLIASGALRAPLWSTQRVMSLCGRAWMMYCRGPRVNVRLLITKLSGGMLSTAPHPAAMRQVLVSAANTMPGIACAPTRNLNVSFSNPMKKVNSN